MIKRPPRGTNSLNELRETLHYIVSSLSPIRRTTTITVQPKQPKTQITMALKNHHIDSGSRVHLRIHAWCERLYIKGVPVKSHHEPLIFDIPQTWENCIRSKKKLKTFRLVALRNIMETEWGRSFHLPGARFQTRRVTIQYQNTQSGVIHVDLDLVNSKNNPLPRITIWEDIKIIHLWIRLTIVHVENWRKIIYASQQKSALRKEKKEKQTPDTKQRDTSDPTQSVPITLSPLQILPISAFLKAH